MSIKMHAEPGAEMSGPQCDYIFRLLEERRVQSTTAAKVIALLLEEPKLSDSGLEMLKNIQRPL